ncbi:isocitrate/isopropylmalate dehydrogenase family protein [Chromobacterium amazonense]|uniref:Isocitrate/isopropylmalate dehydrogenase family protein n=1 Tax=Chromobacterium amazonense TaxID=1382803 RepID=A0ABU8V265_9NEIS|nr:isocitrate/isopropylmalate dehydrogenase family protein [Chromobacterium amazonense]MDQ4540068.1 isocitrate/isopropylmalate dehydrogenase family protein [Chromobacterium amazonense]
MKKILVLPGDGIGRDVCDAALPVFDLLQLPVELHFGDIGWECWRRGGDPVPEETWRQIERSDAVLLGAITSKGKLEAEQELIPELQGKGLKYVSPVIQLRQRLELFANVRPARHLTGARKPFHCVVIRENTEGLYAGMDRKGIPASMSDWVRHPNIDRSGPDEAAISVRLQTRFGLERLFRYAFDYARDNGLDRVTFADKPNVLRDSGQFAADIFHAIAAGYPGIGADIQNVDAVALWLVRRPESFGVIVAENMYGDILSDLAAGVMGGLGVAPSANVGNRVCYFEPVHGSAPAMAGKDKANPAAMFLSIALLLRHLGFDEAAARIDAAVSQTIRAGRALTYDLGGNAGTAEMARAILQALRRPQALKRASILCIGDELLNGSVVNSNAAEIGKRLSAAGYAVGLQLSSPDQLPAIRAALDQCLGQSDLVVVNGGLGPTSDDLTRDGVAAALGLPLHFDAGSMAHIEQRLTGFGLAVNPQNRRQAMFPEGAAILPNANGTAPGFALDWQDRRILVLPGPPRECLPMLDASLPPAPARQDAPVRRWLLLGVIEADIADAVETCLRDAGQEAAVSYLWRYPHVEVSIRHDDDGEPAWLDAVETLLRPHLVSRDGASAVSQLASALAGRAWLLDSGITGADLGGLLPAPAAGDADPVRIRIDASRELAPPWQGVLSLSCQIDNGGQRNSYRLDVPHRGAEVADYVREFFAWSLLRSLNEAYSHTESEPA